MEKTHGPHSGGHRTLLCYHGQTASNTQLYSNFCSSHFHKARMSTQSDSSTVISGLEVGVGPRCGVSCAAEIPDAFVPT